MEKAITQMLNSRDMTSRLYEYPLIANLYQRPKSGGKKGRLPSYIPASKFSATLFELIIKTETDNSPVQTMTDEIETHLFLSKAPSSKNLPGKIGTPFWIRPGTSPPQVSGLTHWTVSSTRYRRMGRNILSSRLRLICLSPNWTGIMVNLSKNHVMPRTPEPIPGLPCANSVSDCRHYR